MKFTIEKAENGFIVSREGFCTTPRIFLDIESCLEYCRVQLDPRGFIQPAPVVKIVDNQEE